MKLRLTSRIVLSFAALAAVLLLTVGTLSYQRGRESLKAAAISELLAQAGEKEAELNAWIDERVADVRQIAGEVDVLERTESFIAAPAGSQAARATYALLERELRAHVATPNAELLELFVVDPATGVVVISTTPETEGKSALHEMYFRMGKLTLHVQPPQAGADSIKPSIVVATPLRLAGGISVGVLVARVSLKALSTIAQRQTDRHKTSDAFLFTAEHLAVTQPRFIAEPTVLRHRIETEAVRLAIEGKNGVLFAKDYRGVPSIAVHRWIANRQLGLIVKIDEAEALAPAYTFGRAVVVISFLTMLATLLVAFFVARTITRPLLALHANVHHFASEAADATPIVSFGDELSELKTEFERMAARVVERTAELANSNTALRNEIREREQSQELRKQEEERYQRQRDALIAFTNRNSANTDDLMSALERLTELDAKTLGVARVSVWRYNEGRTGIRCLDLYELESGKHSSGLELPAAAFPAYFRALADLTLIAADDAHKDPRTSEFSEPYLAPLGISSMLDAPVHLSGVPEGVLCHEHVGPMRTWTPDEKTFAVAIADLVSLALEGSERRSAEAKLRAANVQLEHMVANNPAIIYRLEVNGERARPVAVSANITVALGYFPSETYNDEWWISVLHPEDKKHAIASIPDLYREGTSRTEYRVRRKDGTYVWIDDRRRLLRDSLGRPAEVVGLWIDVSARKETELELQRFKSELEQRVVEATAANEALQRQTDQLQRLNTERAALANMNDLLTACASPEDAYAIFARAAAGLFPSSSGSLHVYPASRNQLVPAAHWGMAVAPEVPVAAESCWALRRGKPYVGDMTMTPPCLHAGPTDDATLCVPLTGNSEVLGVLHMRNQDAALLQSKVQLATIVSDALAITLANLNLRQSLKALAIRDSLTGLFNRRYLDETLARECARARRESAPVAVIMLDVDHFKDYNNRFGHQAGDAVLRELGALLMQSARASDIACRYGGEEFCLVLPKLDHDGAQERAEAIRAAAAKLDVKLNGRTLGRVTISAGVAVFPSDGEPERVLRVADEALYIAKRSGRNRVVVGSAALDTLLTATT